MKKLFLAALVILGGFTVSACTTPINQLIGFDQNDIYALEAISASELLTQSLLQSATTLNLSQTNSTSNLVLLDTTAGASTNPDPGTTPDNAPVVGNDLETVNKYLNMIETFLGNNNGLSVEVVASDLVEYANKIIYTFTNILGEPVSITIYFNEVLYETPINEDPATTTTTTVTTAPELTTEPETTTTTAPETTTTTAPETTTTVDTTAGATTTDPLSYPLHNDVSTDEEIVYSLQGIIVYSNVQYQFDGVKILEDDEEIFRLRSYVDSLNYVKVTYKTDVDGDQKFFYEIVVDGVVTESAKTKVSVEDDGIKVKLEYVQGLAFGQYDFKIEVVANVTTIKIRYSIQSAEGVAEQGNIEIVGIYDSVTDTTAYSYTILPDGKAESHFEGDRDCKGDEEKGQGNGHKQDDQEDAEDEAEGEVEDEAEAEDEDDVNGHHGAENGQHDEESEDETEDESGAALTTEEETL